MLAKTTACGVGLPIRQLMLAICLAIGLCFCPRARAARVPSDVKLAKSQVLCRGNGQEPETLDPQRARGVASGNILRDLYEGLIDESPQGRIVPGAADRWRISADDKVYTFHIRANARWSNGAPVTAADFVAGLRRTVAPKTGSPYADVLWPIRHAKAITRGKLPPKSLGVKALNAHKLEIALTTPTPYLLQLLTHHSTYPIYRPALKKYGRHFTRPGRLISNGAYKLKSWVVNSHITLVRNIHYWNNAHTVIDHVRYYPIENEASELARFRSGDLDITETIPVTEYSWLRRHFGQELHITPYLSNYYYGFNLTRAPFKHAPKLRQALTMSIDRKIIAQKVIGTGVLPAYGWVPPGINNYTTQRYTWADWSRSKRLAMAKQLYKQAGYGPDHPLQVQIRFNNGTIHKRIAQAVAAMWKANLGVKTELINEEWKVFLQDRAQKKITQVFRAGWVGDYNDAYSFAEVFEGGSALNETGYRSRRYDHLIAQAAKQRNLQKRRKLLEAAERIVLHDNPIMPIYYYVSKHLVASYVGGWHNNIVDHHYTKALYIKAH